jgi:hypothetical protein
MPLSRRYTPEHPPQDNVLYGMDFSFILPPGVGISGGQLDIFWNIQPPVAADADWTKGEIFALGRALYCQLGGGTEGKDYQLRWEAWDSEGNTWQRTALVLCAQTS